MTKIAVCIPTNGPPTWQLFDSFTNWQAFHCHDHPEIEVDIIRPPRPLPVDMARNFLAHQVLQGDYDYLWFIDQDASFLPDALDRLMAWNVDIVGGLCLMREPTFCRPMLFRGYNEEREAWNVPVDEVYEFFRENMDIEANGAQSVSPVPDESLFEVDFTGCHCLLIRRDVLEKMEPPWFNGQPGTEDRYFCLKAADLGYKVHVDFSTFIGHATGSRILGVHDYMAHYLLKMALLEDEDDKAD